MAKRPKRPTLSTVVAFMSAETQRELQTQSSTTLPLATIRPDPGQPRRLLPADLAEGVATGTLSPLAAVQRWAERAASEVAEPGLKRNMQELRRLAQSIEQHGLINPISVRTPLPGEPVPPDTPYLIVTGERRYWAHMLLLSEGKTVREGENTLSPTQIKATIAPPGITVRAHQFIENILREDINAVERARGMWALRYELSGVNHGSPEPEQNEESTGLSAAEGEQMNPGSPTETKDEVNHGSPAETEDEVNHGSPQRPKLVPWSAVEAVLGISKRYRIFTTSVLKLCVEAQTMVEAHHLAERTIRPIVQKLADEPALQLKALQQLVAWQTENEAEDGPARSLVASVKELVEHLLAAEAEPSALPKATRAVSSAPVVRFRNKVRQTLDFLNRLKSKDRSDLNEALGRTEFAEVMLDLRNLRRQIDNILQKSEGLPSIEDTDVPE